MSETAKMLHVNLAPGEAGRYAIVPGDPDRCELIAAHLDNPRMVTRKREFTTWEGTLDGERVTVTSTGIGGPSTISAGRLPSSGWAPAPPPAPTSSAGTSWWSAAVSAWTAPASTTCPWSSLPSPATSC